VKRDLFPEALADARVGAFYGGAECRARLKPRSSGKAVAAVWTE